MAYDRTAYDRMIYGRPADRDRTRDFEGKFECRIEDSKEYKQYVRHTPSFGYGWDQMTYEFDTKVVPMKSIHLTIDNLERLLAEHERTDRLLKDAEYANGILSELRANERVRDENPAVAKAYRNYLMLLELARK